MQYDFDRNYPSLDIAIIGINEVGAHPVGFITEGRDLPWLAESDVDGNGLGDIRDDSWHVAYRDVVVVDQQGEMLERYNLTSNSLGTSENYDALKQMFIAAAAQPPESDWQSPIERLDVDADGVIAPVDALIVINELGKHVDGRLPASMANSAPYVDPTGDGIVAPVDALLVINQLDVNSSIPQAALSASAERPAAADDTPVNSGPASILLEEDEQSEAVAERIDASATDAIFANTSSLPDSAEDRDEATRHLWIDAIFAA